MTVLAPEIDSINKPYWDALVQDRLIFQACHCGHKWLPARANCPECLSDDWSWTTANGKGTLVSWVIYHTALHDSYRERLPYNVAIVELDEGPRLITNILADNKLLIADAPVELVITHEEGVSLARFTLAE